MKSAHLFQKALTTQFQSALQYPGEVFIRMGDNVFLPLVVLLIWHTIAQTSQSVSQSLNSITLYYAIIPLIVMFTDAWQGYFVAKEIRQGSFARFLLLPTFPVIFDLAQNFAEKIFKLVFIIPMMALVWYFFQPEVHLTLPILSLTSLTTLLSFLLSFLIQRTIGYAGFWLEEVTSLNDIMYVADVTIGGRAIPLFLFPPLIFQIASILPFRYLTAFPVEIFSGSLTATQIYQGLTIQITWIVFFAVLSSLFWHRGIRKFSAYGG